MARPRTLHPLTPLLALVLLGTPAPVHAVPIVTSRPSVGGTPRAAEVLVFDGRPTPGQIAEASRRIGTHTMFVRAGDVELTFRHARLDTIGVQFGVREPLAAAEIDSVGETHTLRSEWLPLSPVPWERIDRIEIAKPRGTEFALWGAGVGVVAMVSVFSAANESGDGEGVALIAPALLLTPVAGALAGGAIGSLETKRVPVIWRNATPLPAYEWEPDDPVKDGESDSTRSD